ncbi:MAG: SDR family oxidoreductase, partial [Candidatus Altiarchaeota archaeon]
MESLLVTGASGLLGRQMLLQSREKYKCVGVDVSPTDIPCDFFQLDISDKEKTLDLIKEISPSFVVHAAALTNVDYCETHPEEAKAINVEGTRNIALGCVGAGAKMAYVSTDFVFEGSKGRYAEDDKVDPQGQYAKTKLLGELAVKEVGVEYVIARTSVLYGWHPKNFNFVMWVIEKLEKEEEITIVTD